MVKYLRKIRFKYIFFKACMWFALFGKIFSLCAALIVIIKILDNSILS